MDGLKFADADCFLGCGNGILKALSFPNKQFVNLNQLQISNYDFGDVVDMCVSGPNEILVAHETGVVNAYSINGGTNLTESYNADFSVRVLPSDTAKEKASRNRDAEQANVLRNVAVYENRLFACWKSGELTCVSLNKAARSKLKKQSDGTAKEQPKVVANATGNVERLRQNEYARRYVAVGGRENELKLYDLAAQRVEEPVFTARNVAHDWLNVRVPVHIKDIAFLDAKNRMVTVSAHRHVRLYDPSSSQKRPVAELKFGEDALTTVASRPDHMQVVVGNGKGRVGLLDWRQPAHLVRCYKGFVGSVRAVRVDEANSRVLAAGLDRFVLAHNIDSGDLEQRTFVKSQVNCLLVNPNVRRTLATAIESEDEAEQETTAEHDEASFNKLIASDSESEESANESANEQEESAQQAQQSDESDEDEFETGMRLAPLKKTSKRNRDEFVKPSRRKGGAKRPPMVMSHQTARSSKKRRAK